MDKDFLKGTYVRTLKLDLSLSWYTRAAQTAATYVCRKISTTNFSRKSKHDIQGQRYGHLQIAYVPFWQKKIRVVYESTYTGTYVRLIRTRPHRMSGRQSIERTFVRRVVVHSIFYWIFQGTYLSYS